MSAEEYICVHSKTTNYMEKSLKNVHVVIVRADTQPKKKLLTFQEDTPNNASSILDLYFIFFACRSLMHVSTGYDVFSLYGCQVLILSI